MSFFRRYSVPCLSALLLVSGLFVTGCHSDRQEKATLTENRLGKLSMAMALYANDYDRMLPPATDMIAVKKYILPYIVKGETKQNDSPKVDEIFIAPISGKEFAFNGSLSGKTLNIQKRQDGSQYLADSKIIFYEPTAEWKDSQRFTVTQDGIVKRFSDKVWSQIKKENGIP